MDLDRPRKAIRTYLSFFIIKGMDVESSEFLLELGTDQSFG